ncbi:MAG: T9SS type A sorting domain-containing protein [Candidatus Kapaibacterium sp.]
MTFQSGIAWAGTGHVWKSTDDGATWKVTPLNPYGTICQISFIDDHNGLVATREGGVFLTRDGGNSWKTINNVASGCSCLLLDSNTILVCEKEPGGVDYSLDGGKTWNTSYGDSWDHDIIAGPNRGLVYMLSANYTTLMHLWCSNDAGLNWSMQPGTFDVDCWSIALDRCNPKIMYIVNEGYTLTIDYNGVSRIYVTSDGGVTWNITASHPSDYFAGSVVLGPNTVFVPTVSEADAGIFRSLDHGQTWQNIGGPSAAADTRLILAIDDNHLIASDHDGSIWITSNCGGDSVTLPVLPSTPEFLLPSHSASVVLNGCGISVDTSIPVAVISCMPISATLDSVWLSGSPAFSLPNANVAPQTFELKDSIFVSYSSSKGPDTAYLHIQYDLGSGRQDTSIELIGTMNSALLASPSQLHREAASAYLGQVDSLRLGVDISSEINIDSLWPYLNDIQGTFAFDSSIVSFESYTPPPGWTITSLMNRGNAVDFEIHKNSAQATQPLDLGAALFLPNTTQLATSWVTLPRFVLDIGKQAVSLCVTDNEDSHWSVKTLGAESGVAEAPTNAEDGISIYPNPAESEFFVRNTNANPALITLYDAIGRNVASANVGAASTASIDIESLARGSYVVVSHVGDRMMVRRLDKAR